MKKKVFKVVLTDEEFKALRKFKSLTYYDGAYDLHYKVKSGLNYEVPVARAIIRAFRKAAIAARKA